MGGCCRGFGVAGNDLGAEGGRAVAEGLKHNSTVTTLDLYSEFAPPFMWDVWWCGCLFRVVVYVWGLGWERPHFPLYLWC